MIFFRLVFTCVTNCENRSIWMNEIRSYQNLKESLLFILQSSTNGRTLCDCHMSVTCLSHNVTWLSCDRWVAEEHCRASGCSTGVWWGCWKSGVIGNWLKLYVTPSNSQCVCVCVCVLHVHSPSFFLPPSPLPPPLPLSHSFSLCVCVCVCVCVQASVCVCVRASVCMCASECVHVYVCELASVCVCVTLTTTQVYYSGWCTHTTADLAQSDNHPTRNS